MADTETKTGITIEILPEDDLSLPAGFELVAEESIEEPDGLVILDVFAILTESERRIDGEEMLKRTQKFNDRLGLRSAKALQRRQDLIPVKWRGGRILVFTGTVARLLPIGYRCVVYFFFDRNRWYLRWRWLDNNFYSACCSVRRSEE